MRNCDTPCSLAMSGRLIVSWVLGMTALASGQYPGLRPKALRRCPLSLTERVVMRFRTGRGHKFRMALGLLASDARFTSALPAVPGLIENGNLFRKAQIGKLLPSAAQSGAK